jgi:fluoroquinolone transport system permease protein
MQTGKAIRALSVVDIKSIHRDPMLRWLVFYPVAFGLAVRWGTPWLTGWLKARFHFDLQPYFPLLCSFLVFVMPMLAGAIIGFVMLDQRDDRSLTSILVTPLPLRTYVFCRLSIPAAFSFAVSLLIIMLSGLSTIPLWGIVLASLTGAGMAPVFCLFYAAYATNKVQGFALMKATGILFVPPVVAWFVSSGWQWLFGIIPVYWPAKVYWMINEGSKMFWLPMFIGIAYQGFLINMFLSRFERIMRR